MGVLSTDICVPCGFNVYEDQKRTLDLELELEGSFEVPCAYWELNLGPLEEQLLLNAEPCLQPDFFLTEFKTRSSYSLQSLTSYKQALYPTLCHLQQSYYVMEPSKDKCNN